MPVLCLLKGSLEFYRIWKQFWTAGMIFPSPMGFWSTGEDQVDTHLLLIKVSKGLFGCINYLIFKFINKLIGCKILFIFWWNLFSRQDLQVPDIKCRDHNIHKFQNPRAQNDSSRGRRDPHAAEHVRFAWHPFGAVLLRASYGGPASTGLLHCGLDSFHIRSAQCNIYISL